MGANARPANAAKAEPLKSNNMLVLLRLQACCTKSRPRQNLGTG